MMFEAHQLCGTGIAMILGLDKVSAASKTCIPLLKSVLREFSILYLPYWILFS